MANTLVAGTAAPTMKVKDQNGNEISLADYLGSKVILYFYPADDTPGCTAESCNLRDNYDSLLEKGFKVLGVSADDEDSHQKFIEKYTLPFPLIADTDHSFSLAFGTWGEKNLYGKISIGMHRVTFIINEEGVISHVIKRVKTGEHTQQILDLLKM